MKKLSLLEAHKANVEGYADLRVFLDTLIQKQICAYFYNEPLRINPEEIDTDPEEIELEVSYEDGRFVTLAVNFFQRKKISDL